MGGACRSRARSWGLALALLSLAGALPVAMAGEGDAPAEAPAPVTRDTQAAADRFDEGEVQREEFHWAPAANLYWKAIEADPLHYRAHVRYQECALRAGDELRRMQEDYARFVEDYPRRLAFKLHRLRLDPPEGRLAALEALRKAHRKDFDLLLELGRVHLALGDPKNAAKALEASLALVAGDRPDVLVMLAEAEYATENVDAARRRLEGAIQAQPTLWSARLVLARIELLEGQPEKSVELADVVLQQRPTYIAAFLVKGEALDASGQTETAKNLLQTVYDRITKDVPEVTIALADLTAKFETEAAFKQAAALYTTVIEKDGENWRARYGLAWVREREKKYDVAEEGYREVMALRPTSATAVNSVGYCLFKQGRVSQAQVQFKRALDMEPSYVTALANLGSTYDAQAKYGDAIKVYEKILKMKGQKENLRALINCAFDYEAGGAFPKATKLLLRAHAIQPEDPNIMVWLGDNFYFQQKWKDAESWYQKALAKDEKSYFGWRGLGLTLVQRRRWADAANAFEKASQIKPDDLELYITLGDIYYENLKDLESALKNYEQYVQRGGDDPVVVEVIAEIKKELER